jgi:hypothetical protein
VLWCSWVFHMWKWSHQRPDSGLQHTHAVGCRCCWAGGMLRVPVCLLVDSTSMTRVLQGAPTGNLLACNSQALLLQVAAVAAAHSEHGRGTSMAWLQLVLVPAKATWKRGCAYTAQASGFL